MLKIKKRRECRKNRKKSRILERNQNIVRKQMKKKKLNSLKIKRKLLLKYFFFIVLRVFRQKQHSLHGIEFIDHIKLSFYFKI